MEMDGRQLARELKELKRSLKKAKKKHHHKKHKKRTRSASSSSSSSSSSSDEGEVPAAKRSRFDAAPLPVAAQWQPPPPQPPAPYSYSQPPVPYSPYAPPPAPYYSSQPLAPYSYAQQQQQQQQQQPPAPYSRFPTAAAAAAAAAPSSAFASQRGKVSNKSTASAHEMVGYLRCATCGVDSSSEVTFAQHVAGAKHRKTARRAGFAGLVPNAAGLIPRLVDSRLRAAAVAFGHDPDGATGRLVPESQPNQSNRHHHPAPSYQPAAAAARWAPPLQLVRVEPWCVDRLASFKDDDVEDSDSDSDSDDDENSEEEEEEEEEVYEYEGDGAGAKDAGGGGGGGGGERRNGECVGRRRPETAHVARAPAAPAPPVLVNGGPMGLKRAKLPVFAHRGALLEALASLDGSPSKSCLLVEGETGSGKSTQVPQYIIEDAAERGERVSVVVTQPRRIAAIGVADRIAAERGETCGDVVGYTIRGESRASARTCLVFQTTGVALRKIQEAGGLDDVTHVVVDEVHERSLDSDFLLLALRRVVALRRERHQPPLRIVLMSATMPGGAIRDYFGAGCPVVKFPGRTFPVRALYLEHALDLTGHVVNRAADWSRHSLVGQKREKRRAERERSDSYKTVRVLDRQPQMGSSLDRRFDRWPRSVRAALDDMDEDGLNLDLIVELVEWFAIRCRGDVDVAIRDADVSGQRQQQHGGGGSYSSRPTPPPRAKKMPQEEDNDDLSLSVLIFCQGTAEIDAVSNALKARRFGDPAWILPLHGGLPPDEQRRVFLAAPRGVTKVVIATNVAETSVTIPDVGFVIDSGRVKEERYDAERHVASLDDVWIPLSSAKQRRGRAGRVRAGLCVHLFPSDAPLEAQSEPEVRRVALEQLVLRIKALPTGLLPRGARCAADACASLPEPPERAAVDGAAEMLVAIGALSLKKKKKKKKKKKTTTTKKSRHSHYNDDDDDDDDDGSESTTSEKLTPLGALLARLPIDARLAKLAVLGACFGAEALDDALTMAAALANRSPFLSPMERRDAADASKRAFVGSAGGSPCGAEFSDLLAVRNAYAHFNIMGDEHRYAFARDRFLAIKTLQAIAALKRQLLEALSSANFVVPHGLRASHIESLGRRVGGSDGVREALASLREGGAMTAAATRPSDDLVAALVAAALYPQLAYVAAPPSSKTKLPCAPENIKLLTRDRDATKAEAQTCSLHPSSVCSKMNGAQWLTPYAAFHERVRTTRLYVRDATPVPPLAPFLLAGSQLKLLQGGADDELVLDAWLRVRVEPAGVGRRIVATRKRLDRRVAKLIDDAANNNNNNNNYSHPGRASPTPLAADCENNSCLVDAVSALVRQGPQPEPRERFLANQRQAQGPKTNKNAKKRKNKAANARARRQGAGAGHYGLRSAKTGFYGSTSDW